MAQETVAKRYAEALYELAGKEGLEDRIGGELARLEGLWRALPELEKFLVHPLIPREAKERVVEALTDGMHPYVHNLLLLLVRKGRVALLPLIGDQFLEAGEEQGKLVHVLLRIARDLSEGELSRLRARLEKALGKPVALSLERAPELLAGAELVIAGRRLDASVRGKLARLAAGLKG